MSDGPATELTMLDATFGDDDYLWGKEPNSYLVSVSTMLIRGATLCLGDRGGRNAVFLASMGFRPLVVDDSEIGLEQAECLARENGVSIETRLIDWDEFDPGEETFDNVVSVFCHKPPHLRRRLHAAVVRALRPSGMFVLEAFRGEQVRYSSGGPTEAELFVSRDEVLAELEGLECVRVGQVVRTLNEGRYHQGRGAVLEILARKLRPRPSIGTVH